jgi:hypothetical protein
MPNDSLRIGSTLPSPTFTRTEPLDYASAKMPTAHWHHRTFVAVPSIDEQTFPRRLDGGSATDGSTLTESARGASGSAAPTSARSADGSFRTVDYVIAALFRLGGSTRPVDIEDIGMECFRIAPHRFRWRKYPDQIDLAQVRDGLSDARKEGNGVLVVGDRKQGWSLTQAGIRWAHQLPSLLGEESSAGRIRLDVPVRAAEKQRVLASVALRKAAGNQIESVTPQEFRELLRIDRYVTPEKYSQRLAIVLESFADDLVAQSLIADMERRYREGGTTS